MNTNISRTIKPFIDKAINIVFPPQCLSCKSIIESDGSLCHSCWEAIEFISSPQCFICGTPFELASDSDNICGRCITNPVKFTKARAVLRYDENSTKIITKFKYYDNIHASDHFAKWLLRIGKELIDEADIITPVPLHKLRLLSRRYNQSALLCNSIGKTTSKEVCNDLIIRRKNTMPQAGLTFNKRVNNVKSAFIINEKLQDKIQDKNILLIDDVMTTGSTISSCTKTLLKAGAKHVYVLTIAMTAKN